MWPKIKKWLWRFFVLAMALCLIILGALTFFWLSLQKPSYQEYYARKIIEQLPEPWKSNAKCGKIGGRLPGSFLLQDLKVTTPNGDEVTLHNITLSWDWLEILDRKIVIHTIKVEKVKILLQQSKDKKWLPDLVSDGPAPIVEEEEPKPDSPFVIPEIKFNLQTLSLNDIQLQLNSQEKSWHSLNYRLRNLDINAELESDASVLSAALNLKSSMELRLDQYPNLFLKTNMQVMHRDDHIDFKLHELRLNTTQSRISLQSEINLKKFDLNDLALERLFNHLDLTFQIQKSHIGHQDVKLVMEQLELPDDIELEGNIKLRQKNLSTILSLQCDQQNLQLEAHAKQLQLDHPLENQLQAKAKLDCSPDGIIEDLNGKATTQLDFTGTLSKLSSWQLSHDLQANLMYKGTSLPKVKHTLNLNNNLIKTQQSLDDTSVQLRHQLDTSIASFDNLQSIDPYALPVSNELDLVIPQLKQISEKYKGIFPIEQDIRGEHQLNVKLNGNMDSLSYQVSSQNKDLFVDQALPNSLDLNISGKAFPNKLLKLENLPSFPELTFTQNTLTNDLQKLGDYLNTWVEMVELPRIELKASGNELHPMVEKIDLSLSQSSPQNYTLSLSSHTHGQASLIDLKTGLAFARDQWKIELSQLKVNSELAGLWNHPWLEQALNLDQKSTLTLHWNRAELNWTPLVLGKDHWLSTQGSLYANGEINATFQLQTPELNSWLKSMPLKLPMSVEGNVQIASFLKGTWFRPQCQVMLRSQNLAFEKENLPRMNIEKLNLDISLDAQTNQALQVNLQLKPEHETGFQGNLHQSLKYEDQTWMPKLEQDCEFEIGTLNGASMSLRLAEYFLPENINTLKGSWGMNLKGQFPITSPEATDFTGKFLLNQFSANIQEAPNIFKEANLELFLKPNHIEITRFNITQSKGSLDLSGNAFSDNLMSWHNPQWNVKMQMQKWETKALDFASLQSGSKINMHGNLHQHHIKGHIEIDDFKLNPQNLPISSSLAARDPNIEMVQNIKSWEEYDTETQTEKEKVPDALKNARIQIEVKLNRNNWIRDDMFQGELVGKLMIQKDFQQESLHPVGTIHLQRAVLKFQGNRFNMEKGDLNWQGDLIPAINFTFITKVDPYEIKLILREDQADQVKPQFSSQPWLDNSDIISVLLMGRPLHSESEDSGNDSFAQDLAVSQGVSQLSKEMGLGNMGIDIDNVSSKGGTVRVGRYLHPRVYVAIAKTIGIEESNELSLEYLILKNLKFKVTQETQVPMGFDVEWSKDY